MKQSTLNALSIVALALIVALTQVTGSGGQRAQAAPDAFALAVTELDSRPFPCDGQTAPQVDAPLSGKRIRKVVAWFGQDKGGVSDLQMWFGRVSDKTIRGVIAKSTFDHYADPTGVSNQMLTYDFAPDYIQVGADETVRLYAACDNFKGAATRGHIILWVFYISE